MNRSLVGFRAVLVIAILSAAPCGAYAYIDPGSGAYMLQVIFTLIGAAIFYVRHPIRTLRGLFDRVFKRNAGAAKSSSDDARAVADLPNAQSVDGLEGARRRGVEDQV